MQLSASLRNFGDHNGQQILLSTILDYLMSLDKFVPLRHTSAYGKGRAALRSSADEAIFTELSYRYPLKLLSPQTRATPAGIPFAIAYMLSYGGGLVSGDQIDLEVDVGSRSTLMLLTQVKSTANILISSRVDCSLEDGS